MKIYVDTNIFMDIVLDRFDTAIISKLFRKKYNMIISSVVIDELKFNKIDLDIIKWFSLANNLTIVNLTERDKKLAKKFMKHTHCNDALHAAICFNQKIPILTRNVKDFIRLPITVIHPDDL